MASLVESNEASQNPLQGFTFIVHSAFLRLYLGSRASQAAILKLAESLYGTAVDGIQVSTIVGRVWDGIVQVDLSTITDLIVVGTPNATHYEFAKSALLAGKHGARI